MLAIVFIISVVSLLGQADASVKCFECVDMPHPQDCPTITTCTSHEICYVEQFVTSGGQLLYNSGCLSKAKLEKCAYHWLISYRKIDHTRCTSGGKRAVPYGKHYFQRLQRENNLAIENEEGLDKRQNPVSVTDIATCIQCCDGNFCNVEGCGTTAVTRLNRGPKCFSCSAQADPESCRDTMQCDRDQVCAIYRPLNRLAFDEWATECMGELQCNGIVKAESIQLSNFVGKRDLLSVNKCPRCCTDDLCNYSCRQNLTVTHTTAIPTLAPTHPTTHPTVKPTTKATVHQTHPTTHPTTKVPVHHTHPTTKPTTKVPVHHHHTQLTTKPTTKAPVHHHHTQSTTKPTTKVHLHHTHPTTKPTTKVPVHHSHPTTKPTTKLAVHHTQPTTKPTPKPTTKLTTTTLPPPTTDPAIGCKVDGYIYDPPTKLCLKFYESPKLNWTEAQQHCNSTKGKLAIITDDQKIKDVLNFYKHFGYTSPLWVGATDFGNGHVFTFTDGSKLTVDPAEGQDLRNSNCLYVTGGSYKGFGPCSDKHGFICERSSTIRA